MSNAHRTDQENHNRNRGDDRRRQYYLMNDAIVHGSRLIMMYEGNIVLDIAGEDKKKLTVEQLLAMFGQVTGSDEADDKLLLS